MTQVSKLRLRVDIEKRIYDLLDEVITGIKNKNDFSGFLDEFLSPIEKTVLAKRLAIAVLLAKGNEYSEIRQILRVTPITISKVSLRMKYGSGFLKKIAERVANSDDNKALIQELVGIFDVPIKGVPRSEYHKKVHGRNEKIYRLKREL